MTKNDIYRECIKVLLEQVRHLTSQQPVALLDPKDRSRIEFIEQKKNHRIMTKLKIVEELTELLRMDELNGDDQ